ncbi:MAG: TIGR00300 family protein, partial [Spirochaetia bacterium]
MNRRFISEGHLIDSGILTRILNLIIDENADYQIISFDVGKQTEKVSRIELDLICGDHETLEIVTDKLVQAGCYEKKPAEAVFKPAPKKGCVPEDFYSTTNHRTEVFFNGAWHSVKKQRMDAVIVHNVEGLECKKLRDIDLGEPVLCSSESVRLFPPEMRLAHENEFGFMINEVSSERSVAATVNLIAQEMQACKDAGQKVVMVSGPVVVHTGGSPAFSALLREGYIHGVLAGNALAVHDMESIFYGTSLGVDLETGKPIQEGHKNHMRAINKVRFYGSIKEAISAGAVQNGIMYEIIQNNIPYCLAGSIRDDGPLPETQMNIIKAQEEYAEIIKGASMVIMLSTMLHSIGTGNMLPSWVKTVCVDINPAVVTKLSDRGSSQTVGIVSDVG